MVKRMILFGVILGLAGCQTTSWQTPNLGAELTGNGVELTSDFADLAITAEGVELDTPEFTAGFVLCLKSEGGIADTIAKIPGGIGRTINAWITCGSGHSHRK